MNLDRLWRTTPEPGVRLHALTLRFSDAPTEHAYQGHYAAAFMGQARLAAVLGATLYAVAGLALAPAITEHRGRALVLWYAVTVPLALGAMAISYTRRGPRLMQPVVAAATLITSLVGILLTMAFTEGIDQIAYPSMMVMFVYLFTLSRGQFPYAVATAVPMVIGYEVFASLDGDMGARERVYTDAIFYSALILAGTAGYSLERLLRRDFVSDRVIHAERARAEQLLLNVLPAAIAERLKGEPGIIADGFADVSVLFADLVGFTPHSQNSTPLEVVELLDAIFSRFDDIAEHHGLEKIKTIGDAYMVVGGVPAPRPDHAVAIVEMALAMRAAIEGLRWPGGDPVAVRIGVASGPVVAGVIGRKKFAYDLWGDTVNTASRMESHSSPSHIQVAEGTYERLRDEYAFEARRIEVKGKGLMTTYFLTGRLAPIRGESEAAAQEQAAADEGASHERTPEPEPSPEHRNTPAR